MKWIAKLVDVTAEDLTHNYMNTEDCPLYHAIGRVEPRIKLVAGTFIELKDNRIILLPSHEDYLCNLVKKRKPFQFSMSFPSEEE